MKTKKKIKVHHRIHRHLKKHLGRLKRKRPRVHKALVLMSITIPVMLGAVLFGSSALYFYESYFDLGGNNAKEKITVDIPVVPDDTLNWKTYKDDQSGFSIKYSDRWGNPKEVSTKGKYLKKVLFDNGLLLSDERYNGFTVSIYDAKKFPSPVGTDELTAKNSATYERDSCDKAEFLDAIIGEEGYPSQEVDISPTEKCFSEIYFFSITRGGYTYNIVPLVGGKVDLPIDVGLKSNVIALFPKFFEITSTITLPKVEVEPVEEEDTVKKPVMKKTEPRRVLKSLGRCRHKNDHPRKSKTKKHRHMDEDCCMDPDEWPNPRCQY